MDYVILLKTLIKNADFRQYATDNFGTVVYNNIIKSYKKIIKTVFGDYTLRFHPLNQPLHNLEQRKAYLLYIKLMHLHAQYRRTPLAEQKEEQKEELQAFVSAVDR